MLNIKEMVKDNKQVSFVRLEHNQLWYVTECGFEFPIPAEDFVGAKFLAKDKAMLFMRWIRRQIIELDQARAAQAA